MGKDKDITPIIPIAAKPPERHMCVVCGSYEGDMPGQAGSARWHAACEESHPAVVAKVKKRAVPV